MIHDWDPLARYHQPLILQILTVLTWQLVWDTFISQIQLIGSGCWTWRCHLKCEPECKDAKNHAIAFATSKRSDRRMIVCPQSQSNWKNWRSGEMSCLEIAATHDWRTVIIPDCHCICDSSVEIGNSRGVGLSWSYAHVCCQPSVL